MAEFKPKPMAPPGAPMEQFNPMAPRMISMNPESGLSMMRRPSGPMSMPTGMPAQQIAGMTPEMQQQLIARSLMPPPMQAPQQVQNPMMMMGNLFGMGKGGY